MEDDLADRRKLDRVGDQVQQDLAQPEFVKHQPSGRRSLHVQAKTNPLCGRLDHGDRDDLRGQGHDVAGRGVEFDFSGSYSGEIQYVVDGSKQDLAGEMDADNIAF